MHSTSVRVALVATLAGLGLTAPALAAAPQAVGNDIGVLKADWKSAPANGFNTSYFLDGTAPGQKGTCGTPDDPQTACDSTLVHVTGTYGEGSEIKFRIDGFQPVSDFDLRVYTADANGQPETYLGSPTSTDTQDTSPLGSKDPRATSAGDYEYKVLDLTQYADPDTGAVDQSFVVEVPYFIVAQDSYSGHVTVTPQPFVAPTP